jgi:hypothetical protein
MICTVGYAAFHYQAQPLGLGKVRTKIEASKAVQGPTKCLSPVSAISHRPDWGVSKVAVQCKPIEASVVAVS